MARPTRKGGSSPSSTDKRTSDNRNRDPRGLILVSAQTLLDSGTTGTAYETVEDAAGALPLLAPISGVARHIATLMGSRYLAKSHSGRGTLLGRVLAQSYGRVLVIGDGGVGRHAARAAAALGAHVTVAGRHPDRVPDFRRAIADDVEFVLSEPRSIAECVSECDLVVGAVLR